MTIGLLFPYRLLERSSESARSSRRLLTSWRRRAPEATVNGRDPKVSPSNEPRLADGRLGDRERFPGLRLGRQRCGGFRSCPPYSAPSFGEPPRKVSSAWSSRRGTKRVRTLRRGGLRQDKGGSVGTGLTSPRWVRSGRHTPGWTGNWMAGPVHEGLGCRVDGRGHGERSAAA